MTLTSEQIISPERLLERLNAANGVLRKVARDWCLVEGAGRVESSATAVPESLIAGLVARGRLLPRPGGGLQTKEQAMARSGRLGEHRPPRPAEGAPAAAPTLNDAESPLAWLRSRRDAKGRPLVSQEQYLAGERLRAGYERSMLERRTTTNWDFSAASAGRGSGHDLTDSILSARRELARALDAVGPELSGMLVQVCCLSAGLEQAERLLELPQRSGKAVLALSLTRLARHYGLIRTGVAPGAGQPSAHWALADYRPAIIPQA